MKRRTIGERKKKLYTKRFFPAGNYTWVVPDGCTEVDVFLVGGGGGGSNSSGGGGGFTKTFKRSKTGWRDGDAISVTPGEKISVIVGAGGSGFSFQDWTPNIVRSAGYSQFKNSNYRADGGVEFYMNWNNWTSQKSGSGGAICISNEDAGSLGGGSDGNGTHVTSTGKTRYFYGQGHTTRDFGEPNGKRNAGGGGGGYSHPDNVRPGVSDYTEGSGANGYSATGSLNGIGGGGYGGGGGGGGGCGGWGSTHGGKGGDGTVLIRYYAY